MIDDDPAQGTNHSTPPSPSSERQAFSRALPWLVAVVALVLLAGVAGLGTAYLVASLRAAPSPDAAFLPTPTPTASPTPRASAPTTAEPTAEPGGVPTPEPTAEPSPDLTPDASPQTYTVQRGDSIGRIAARFGVTPEAIIALNELRNPNRILPGQVLLIPTASASPTP